MQQGVRIRPGAPTNESVRHPVAPPSRQIKAFPAIRISRAVGKGFNPAKENASKTQGEDSQTDQNETGRWRVCIPLSLGAAATSLWRKFRRWFAPKR